MPVYRIVGIAVIVLCFILMKRVTRSSPAGSAGTPGSEVLAVAAIFGLAGGVASYLHDPEHFWNLPLPWPDKLIYWIAGLFAALAVIRIMFGVRPIGKKLLGFLFGAVIAILFVTGLGAVAGSPR